MPYVINNRSGDTIVIPDETLNQDYSIDLVGRNYENYGSVIATGFVDLLNNFATINTPPVKATSGQLWYDRGSKQLRVYDGNTGAWVPQGIQVLEQAPANTHSQNKAGVAYFNTTENQLFVHNGLGYRPSSIPGGALNETSAYSGPTIGSPSSYGSRVRHIFLADTGGEKRSVLALVYVNNSIHTSSADYDQERIIAVFSGHADEFTVADADSDVAGTTHNYLAHLTDSGNGVGTVIHPGINVRKDSTGRVNYATTADRAATSYKLNLGSIGNDGANIDAGNVYHNQISVIPSQSTQQLGNNTSIWSETHTGDLYVGGTQPVNRISKGISAGTVDIGTSADPFDAAYITDLFVSGDIISDGGLGNATNRIPTIYADEIFANKVTIDGYTLPTSAGDANDMMVLGSTGNVVFKAQPQRVGSITSDDNSILISDTSTETVDAENGITLTETSYDYTLNVAYTRGLISSANTSNISYDPETGNIDLTRTTPLDGFVPDDFVQVTKNQTIGGQKGFQNRVTLNDGLTFGARNHEIQFSNNLGFKRFYADGEQEDDTPLAGDNQFIMYMSGDFVAAGDITAYSDFRLKTNLKQITGALDKVKQLTGYVYNRVDDDDNKLHTGLIAQDVKQILPEAVHQHDTGYLSVAYGNMMGLIVESIKDLEQSVAELRSEIASLKTKK